MGQTLWPAIQKSVAQHGASRTWISDPTGVRLTGRQLLFRTRLLQRLLEPHLRDQRTVGVLLPTAAASVITFLALQAGGRLPAMLNFTAGPGPMQAALELAGVRVVLTSRQFLERAGLNDTAARLARQVRLWYLEDLRRRVPLAALLPALVGLPLPPACAGAPDDPAVILFTSGSEGRPKGVALSHANLLTNHAQILERLEFTPRDVMLNVLPLFHSFGLTVGTLVPLLGGLPCHHCPSPIDYRGIPAQARRCRATLLAATDTFLAGYGRYATPEDFASLRLVFAGAEPLRERTVALWRERFGLDILEGYGTTETSPVLAVNSPRLHRPGSVGRPLAGVETHLEPVPGLTRGQRLLVRGPNVMLGYLTPVAGGSARPQRPDSTLGPDWYDTGDVVTVDDAGFITIVGRAKRFAKIGGEMVSLAAAEELAAWVWPDHAHGVVALADPRKGERLVLLTEHPAPRLEELLAGARKLGLGELAIPRYLHSVAAMPRLGSGKVDYQGLMALAAQLERSTPPTEPPGSDPVA
ncbi:MAG: AMP-binding protein [Magnetococcales bacterium]|nr:AMP-binding protein [Magnetococcales bacterium]